MGCSQKIRGEFVEARRDASPVLDAAEVVFDLMPAAVEAFRTIGFLAGVSAARNDRQGAVVLDRLADLLAVVGFVGGDGERRARRIEHLIDDLTVVDLPARDDEVQRSAPAIDDRVDFRAPAAAADTDRLIFLPPFAPLAARCAFTTVLSMK
jgi:hypothetical protein